MANLSLKDNVLSTYIRESYEELRKVSWPNRKQVLKDTLIVVGLSVAIGLFFAGADYVLQMAVQRVIEL